MKVLSIHEDLYAPRMCVICENGVAHTGAETYVIDPDRSFGPDSNFQGRKYVCEQCARLIANAIGVATTEQVARAEFDRDVAQQQLATVRQRVDALSRSVADSVNADAIKYEGASFEDLFSPPDVEAVRVAASNRVSVVESRSEPAEETSGSSGKKSAKTASRADS